jgi:Ca2+-binding EF-hand superfamily protein
MLSPFVKRKIALAFYRMDFTKDGLVKQEDLMLWGQKLAEHLKAAKGSTQYDQVTKGFATLWDAWCATVDKDGDGAVTLEEVIENNDALTKLPNPREISVASSKVTFDAIDLNGNGRIDVKEFAAFVAPLGVSEAQAREAFSHLDRDGSGYISRDEFANDWYDYWASDDREAPGNWFYGTFAG